MTYKEFSVHLSHELNHFHQTKRNAMEIFIAMNSNYEISQPYICKKPKHIARKKTLTVLFSWNKKSINHFNVSKSTLPFQWANNQFCLNLRGPQNFAKFSSYFWLQYIQSKVRWRFCKILWPSMNIWTLQRFSKF